MATHPPHDNGEPDTDETGEDDRTYVGSSTTRNQLSELLSRVQYTDERFVICRHGKPVAAMVPVEDLEHLEELEDAADLEALRRIKSDPDAEFLDWEDVRDNSDE